MNRFALFGFSGHALWSGLVGAGFGLARTLDRVEAKTAAVLAGWLAGVTAHALHNALGTAVLVSIAASFGVDPGEPTSLFLAWASAAITWLVIEGPFMILMALCLINSGVWERQTIAIVLAAESPDVVTAAELEAARTESIWRLRRLDSRSVSNRLVKAQNHLALRRWSAERAGLDPATEPGLENVRDEIARIRS
ncbi:MAG TPA: PrsW family glutamic-type intramembrane protease, partial [Acidimicrobiia bacterium]|nr:PrsW family glutamic-type intramembrane protease [Acidimicrobiia bacterium]